MDITEPEICTSFPVSFAIAMLAIHKLYTQHYRYGLVCTYNTGRETLIIGHDSIVYCEILLVCKLTKFMRVYRHKLYFVQPMRDAV